MCYLERHVCTSCKYTHDELVPDRHAKQPEVLWSKVLSCPKMRTNEVYEGPEGCLFCYEKEYRKLEAMFDAKMKRKYNEARRARCTFKQIAKLGEGLRIEFEMEVRVLREEFNPYGG